MSSKADRVAAMVKTIKEHAGELMKKGMKSHAHGMAAGAILGCQLIDALNRIDRLEGEIMTLSEKLAGPEKNND